MSGHESKRDANTLASLHPEIAAQWDKDKNGSVTPEKVSPYSRIKRWWLCGLGHSWAASVAKRVNGEGCPFCSGNRVLKGFNDLATTRPDIAADWDADYNGTLTPETVSKGSSKMIRWKCALGHCWFARVYSRTAGNGCPYCAGNKVWPGFNDLLTVNPVLAADWDYEKNGTLTPESVTANSNKGAWWLCPKGHSWFAKISSRSAGRGCPYCGKRKLLPGENDLATVCPPLAAQWNFKRNGSLTPDKVFSFSHAKVWWEDEFGHEWMARISNRSMGDGCPYCAGKKVLPGFNDLATKAPEIASEWDYAKNGDRTPQNTLPNSHWNAHWICPEGHEWTATVASRHFKGSGCPYCGNRKALPGKTDFASAHPELMEQWDFELNRSIDPTRLTRQSKKGVHWKCAEGHSWYASIYDRVHGRGCPFCNYKRDKHIVVPGVNDLKTARPDLAGQWDTERNGIGPENVMPYSNRNFGWICENGHRWFASPNSRMNGKGCPFCDGKTPPRMRIV